MSIRDKLKRDGERSSESITESPPWISKPTNASSELFKAAQTEFARIKDLIQTGKATSEKDKRLVLANIARIAKKDRSLLNHRRQPDLCDWIAAKNEELAELTKNFKLSKNRSKSASNAQLRNLIAQLRNEAKLITQNTLREFVEEIFKSRLLDDRDLLAKENIRLREERKKLLEKVNRLQEENRVKNETIIEIIQILNPRQRASLKNITLT